MDKSWNISNPLANTFLLPVSIWAYTFFFDPSNSKDLITFVFCYLYFSYFLSPDLDHDINRPGKGHFPLGSTLHKGVFNVFIPLLSLGIKPLRNILSPLFYYPLRAINRLWFYFWAPYAYLFTHRGTSHLPIFGTFIRLLYLYAALKIISIFFPETLSFLDGVDERLNWAMLLREPLTFIKGVLLLLTSSPVLLSLTIADINHAIVDGLESITKGHSYCPPKIKRGALVRLLKGPF
ncbi:MAG: hypothetical protein GY909_15480 [Oligoflexia bacterium]|nr:hypothetical protein [Oligoflexia bacterium]